jgi:DNA polymerase III delta prime subunit
MNHNPNNKILNRESISEEIKNILSNFSDNCKNIHFKKGIYIFGSPGCGKTTFITEVLNELKYDMIKYDAGDIRNKSLIDTITSDNVASQNVLDMMSKKKKPIIIVMDEIDGMNNGDKGGITALIKLIRQKKTKKQRLEQQTLNPIICIGNYNIDKKIRELMKVCHTFELKIPTNEQVFEIIDNTFISIESTMKRQLVQYIQGDLRKLTFLTKIYNKNPHLLNEDMINSIFHMKSYNDDSKQTTQRLLHNKIDLSQHNQSMNETDRTIIALLWHENIVDQIEHIPKEQSVPFYNRVLDNICFADFIDRITFQNQIWQFNEMSSMIKTFYNNKIYHETIGPREKIEEIRFTKVLTKYSTEYNNSIFIYDLCQKLDMDRKDLVSMFQELRLRYGENILKNNHPNFEEYNISKLDIKRLYRYLDKNIKKEVILEEDSDDEDE